MARSSLKAAGSGTVFNPATQEVGEIKGLGRITVREARLGDIWPYMNDARNPTFSLRVLAASLLIDGEPMTFERMGNLGVRHLKALRGLLPDVMKINGLDRERAAEEDDEVTGKNGEGGEAVVAANRDA